MASDLPALRFAWLGDGTSFASRSNSSGISATASSKAEVMTGRVISGVPDVSLSSSSRAAVPRFVASTEDWDHVNALTPEEAFAAEAERRRRLLRAAPEEAAPASLPSWFSPLTSS